MKITIEKNDLAEFSVDVPDEYYKTLCVLKHNDAYSVFGLSQKEKEALEYLKTLMTSLNTAHINILLTKLNLNWSDVYGKSN